MINRNINVIDDFLSKKECEDLISNYNDNIDYIHKKIENFINENYIVKGFKFNKLKPIKFNKYTPDTQYSLKWIINEKSYFTFIIQLNEDFENGYHQFLLFDNDNYYQVPKKSGSLIIFFSNLKQRLAPVLDKEKYTISTEIDLKKTKISKTLI